MKLPIVLRIGDVCYAHESWKELEKICTLVDDNSNTREEFIQKLQKEYADVKYITRTFGSVQKTGLFDSEIISHLPKGVVSVSHRGAGYDQIDPYALLERGIQLSNVPTAVNNATADAHIYLMLGALRNFGEGHRSLLDGKWRYGQAAGTERGHDPIGKTLGIVGLGGIGRSILEKVKPLKFKNIIYHNRNELNENLGDNVKWVPFDVLIEQSDVISISIPLNKNTKNLFDKEVFAKMKKGVVIVNTARGEVIDEQALIDALKDGTVRSAGLDVFCNEPNINMELCSLPNVLALPHMGTHSCETLKMMEEVVIKNVRHVIETGKVCDLVPEHRGHF